MNEWTNEWFYFHVKKGMGDTGKKVALHSLTFYAGFECLPLYCQFVSWNDPMTRDKLVYKMTNCSLREYFVYECSSWTLNCSLSLVQQRNRATPGEKQVSQWSLPLRQNYGEEFTPYLRLTLSVNAVWCVFSIATGIRVSFVNAISASWKLFDTKNEISGLLKRREERWFLSRLRKLG